MPRCSKCGEIGHYRITCRNLRVFVDGPTAGMNVLVEDLIAGNHIYVSYGGAHVEQCSHPMAQRSEIMAIYDVILTVDNTVTFVGLTTVWLHLYRFFCHLRKLCYLLVMCNVYCVATDLYVIVW